MKIYSEIFQRLHKICENSVVYSRTSKYITKTNTIPTFKVTWQTICHEKFTRVILTQVSLSRGSLQKSPIKIHKKKFGGKKHQNHSFQGFCRAICEAQLSRCSALAGPRQNSMLRVNLTHVSHLRVKRPYSLDDSIIACKKCEYPFESLYIEIKQTLIWNSDLALGLVLKNVIQILSRKS